MNRAGTAKFFKFCRERHSIFLKKEAGYPCEDWTRDKILGRYKFTNVFRELDRTTQWFEAYVRGPMRDLPHVMLATVVFRMFNRIKVGEAVFCQGDLIEHGTAFSQFADTGNTSYLRRAIKDACGDGPYVTGAYIISSPSGSNKLDGMLKVVGDFYKRKCERPTCGAPDWLCCAERLLSHTHTMEQVWNWLREFDYLGNFHSYEIVCDLRYTKLLENAPDVDLWCSPGPGARRGMNRMLGRPLDFRIKTEDLITLIHATLMQSRNPEHWPQPAKAYGVKSRPFVTDGYEVFTHRRRPMVSQWPAWEMREVEHSLCEFDKYERVRSGEGRPRSVYR
jgi:hypothetical protein